MAEHLTSLHFDSGVVVHGLLPPHEATSYTSISWPFAFGVSFTGHHDAIIQTADERPVAHSFGPGMTGLNGCRPLTWLRVAEPSEGVEVHPSAAVLREVSALTGCDFTAHDSFTVVPHDPIVWGVCARFRSAAVGGKPLAGLDADSLIHELTLHVATQHLGGKPLRFAKGRLDRQRLARVTEFLRENVHRALSLTELSAVAAMSPYHLQRAFQRSTGLSPTVFAMLLRLEHARRLLEAGRTTQEAATATGFRDLSYFRRCYQRHFGGRPS